MLCSVCIEWILCKGLRIAGEPSAASQGQAKGVGWGCHESQVGPHPLSLMTTLVISPTPQGYLSMGGGGEAERPKESKGYTPTQALQGWGWLMVEPRSLVNTHLPTCGSEAEQSERPHPPALATHHPQQAPLPALLHSYFDATTLKKWNMTCCLLFKKCC